MNYLDPRAKLASMIAPYVANNIVGATMTIVIIMTYIAYQ